MFARRIGLAAFGILLSVSTTHAQDVEELLGHDYHLYAGGVLAGEEHTRGALVGLIGTVHFGWFALAMGVDGHRLWHHDEGQAAFDRAMEDTGADTEIDSNGLNAVFGLGGGSFDGRRQVIPIGIIGYTRTNVEICIHATCAEESATIVNYGFGLITAIKGGGGRGLHTGLRWTRNYGVALTVGFVW